MFNHTKYQKQWRDKNRERYNELQRKWRKAHPDYHKRFKKSIRNNILNRKYGLTIESYESILKEQKECCKICGRHKSEFKRNLAVDHCHTTNKIRGLLCHHCNAAIGHFFEDPSIMEKAILYIKENGH